MLLYFPGVHVLHFSPNGQVVSVRSTPFFMGSYTEESPDVPNHSSAKNNPAMSPLNDVPTPGAPMCILFTVFSLSSCVAVAVPLEIPTLKSRLAEINECLYKQIISRQVVVSAVMVRDAVAMVAPFLYSMHCILFRETITRDTCPGI
jgi:hypothetical protein